MKSPKEKPVVHITTPEELEEHKDMIMRDMGGDITITVYIIRIV